MYLDEVFAKYEECEELKGLKEAILADCEARYQDCLAKGKSEEESTAIVFAFLGNLEELLSKEMQAHHIQKNDLVVQEPQSNQDHPEKESIQDDSIHSIIFELVSVDLELYPSMNDQIQIDTHVKYETEVIGSTMYIRQANSHKKDIFSLLSFMDNSGKMKVYLPSSVNDLSIHTMMGDIKVHEGNFETFDVQTSAGDFKGEIANAKNVYFKTSAGDVDLLLAGVQCELHLETSCGDIKADCSGVLNGSMKLSAGDVHLKMEDAFENLSIQTSMGDVKVELSDLNEVHIDTKTSIGDIKNEIVSTGNRQHLQVQTSAGDIRIFEA